MSNGHSVRRGENAIIIGTDNDGMVLQVLGFSAENDVIQVDIRATEFGQKFHTLAYLTPSEALKVSKALREIALTVFERSV